MKTRRKDVLEAGLTGAKIGAIVGIVLGVLWSLAGVVVAVALNPIHWVVQIGVAALLCAVTGFALGAILSATSRLFFD